MTLLFENIDDHGLATLDGYTRGGGYEMLRKALTMEPEERALRAKRLKEIITERDPGDWVDEQMADIRLKRSPAEVGR